MIDLFTSLTLARQEFEQGTHATARDTILNPGGPSGAQNVTDIPYLNKR